MIKSDITFEKILGTFVPGAIFIIGNWYFHRPFLFRYFPYVAGDPTSTDAVLGKEIRLLLFIIGALSVGLTFNHFSDVFIAALFKDDASSDKSLRKGRHFFRQLMRLTGVSYTLDPRTRAINRYLHSPRKERFMRMIGQWVGADEKTLENPNESIIAHQHVLFRLRVMCEESRKLLTEAWFPVNFSATLVCSFVALIPSALVSLLLSIILDKGFRYFLIIPIAILYIAIVISSYSLKRQFRQFCQYSLTLGLHFYEVLLERDSSKSPTNRNKNMLGGKQGIEEQDKSTEYASEVALQEGA